MKEYVDRKQNKKQTNRESKCLSNSEWKKEQGIEEERGGGGRRRIQTALDNPASVYANLLSSSGQILLGEASPCYHGFNPLSDSCDLRNLII